MYPFVQFHAKVTGAATARRATIHELPQFLFCFKEENPRVGEAAGMLKAHIAELMTAGFPVPMGNSRPKLIDKNVLAIPLSPEDGVILCLYMHMTKDCDAQVSIKELAKRVRSATDGYYTAAEVTKLFTFPRRVDMGLIRNCFACLGKTFDISIYSSQHQKH